MAMNIFVRVIEAMLVACISEWHYGTTFRRINKEHFMFPQLEVHMLHRR
jgi:hypothetical protein